MFAKILKILFGPVMVEDLKSSSKDEFVKKCLMEVAEKVRSSQNLVYPGQQSQDESI